MSRSGVLRGKDIDLVAYFLDAANDYIDPTNLKMSVYPPRKDPRLGATEEDAWVYEVTTSFGGSGPYAEEDNYIVRIEEGKYKYVFTVPAEASLGTAFDRWQCVVDAQNLDETFAFVITDIGEIGVTQLYNNNVVFVELDETIADTDGNTLDSDWSYYFTTTYDPLYSAVRRIRLDLGSAVEDVPDDTINMAIFEASLEAAALTFGILTFSSVSESRFFYWARRQYATCVAELIVLAALTGTGGTTEGKSKTLADLAVVYRGGPIDDLIEKAIACRNKWEAVLTSVGEAGPGTGLKPQMVIKSDRDPDKPFFGRDWERVSTYGYPAANTKSKYSNKRRWKRDFKSRW